MQRQTVNYSRLYQTFGVAEYVEKLKAEKEKAKLEQLGRVLARYIASKAVDDLPEDALQELDEKEIKDEKELFDFFVQNIINFTHKLDNYGRNFRRRFADTEIIS